MTGFNKKQRSIIILLIVFFLPSIAVLASEPTKVKTVPVFVNQVLKPYTLIKKITTEAYVLDAKSEEEAELGAFKQLQTIAASIGANGLIEVKRYIIKDNVATRPITSNNSSMLKDDIDATGEVLDELTLDSYQRGKGTLSSSLIDQTFDRSKLSEKVIRFSGKAIKFN